MFNLVRISCLTIVTGNSLSRSQSVEQRMEQVNEEKDEGKHLIVLKVT